MLNNYEHKQLKNNAKGSFETTHYRFNFVFNYTAILGIAVHTFLIFLFIVIGIKEMALYNILSSLSWYLIYRINKKGYSKIGYIIGYIEVAVHSTLGLFYMGWESGVQYFIFISITVLFYMPYFKKNIKFIIFLISILLFILQFKLFHNTEAVYQLNSLASNTIYCFSLITTFTLLSLLAHLYNIAAEKTEEKLKEVNKKLKLMASTDHLTGLANRRCMLNRIKSSIIDYEKNNSIFSLIIADIDDFKKINDQYGHNYGDLVLKTISDLLENNLRKNDTLARWGGEEFLILLAETNYEEACHVANKLKESIATLQYNYLDKNETLSMTFGISQFKGDLDKCISQADKALYKGKKAGKDCVVIYNNFSSNK